MKISGTTLKILTISLLLSLLTACAVKAYKLVPGDYHSEEGYAIIRTDSLQIAIRPESYRGGFRDANSQFFPVRLQVRNISARRINLAPSSFSILAEDRQYDYIPLDYVLSSSQSRFYLDDWQDPFITDPQVLQDRERKLDDYYELLSNYFSFGELLPGAGKDGYLFYPRAVSRHDSISIDVLGRWVQFKR